MTFFFLLALCFCLRFAENKALIAGTLDAPAESMFADVPRLALVDGKWLELKYTGAEGWEIL
jgi:hypothetical protein